MVGLEAGVDRPGARLRPDANLLLVLPAAAVILICFVWPVVNLLGLSFTQPRPGLANYMALVTHPVTTNAAAADLRGADPVLE